MKYNDIAELIVLFSMAGYVAYRLIRWLWPIAQMRKNLTAAQMMERAILAPQEEQQREITKYGSRRKTLVVNLMNFAVLLSWLYLSSLSLLLFWLGLGYLCIGFLVIRSLGVPQSDALEPLNFLDRVWLYIFHALFWPWYIKKAYEK